MPAKAGEQRRCGAEGGEKVDLPCGAPAAHQLLPLPGKDDGGVLVALRQLACRQAHHTRIPALSGRHQAAQGGEVLFPHLRLRRCEHLPLHLAALGVQAVKRLGDGSSLARVCGQKQLQRVLCRVQPAPGIEPGRQLVAHLLGGDGRARFEPSRLHQRQQAGPGCFRHRRQPQGGDHPVFTHQGHQVCDGGQRRQLKVFEPRLMAQKGLRQFEGNTCPAQCRKGIIAKRRVHQGVCRGQLPLKGMVIGDDDSQAQRLCQAHLLQRRDAAVHADDHPRPPADLRHRLGVEAIALLLPVRDIGKGCGADFPERLHQDGRGAYAVRVIVAINGDGLPLAGGIPDQAHGRIHPLHPAGVVQLCGLRVQEGFRGLHRVNPPGMEKGGQVVRVARQGKRGGALGEGKHGVLSFEKAPSPAPP